MPGTTSGLALPYPFINETVDSDSVKNLADEVDSELNTSITDANAVNKRPAALVVRDSGSQSFASGAALANLTYVTEKYDNNGMGNLGTNNERLTVATSGVYLVTARAMLDGNFATSVSSWMLAITINGTILAATKRRGGSPAGFTSCCDTDLSCVLMRRLSATDIIRAQFTWTGTTSPRNIERAELGARWICSL